MFKHKLSIPSRNLCQVDCRELMSNVAVAIQFRRANDWAKKKEIQKKMVTLGGA